MTSNLSRLTHRILDFGFWIGTRWMVNRGMILPSPHHPATLCLSECAIVNRENSYPISLMRVWRSLPQILLATLVGLCLTLTLHACQMGQVAQAPISSPVAASSVAQSVTKPTPMPMPPETKAIVARAGSRGLFNPPRGDIRMVVISDLNSSYGSTTYDPEVKLGIQLIPFWSPDLVLCGGDMVAGQDDTLSNGQIQAMWDGFDRHVAAPLRKMNVPFGFTIGNHDGSSALGASNQFLFERDRAAAMAYWNAPNHDPGVQFVDKYEFPFYYTFKFQDVFFLVWDGSSNTIPADKLKWVETALASEPAQSAKMRMLIGHLPLYSVAAGRNTLGDVMRDADQLRAMLEKYQVHTYISGHHHAYYPAHRGNLQMLHSGILGSGPRSLLDTGLPPRKTLTVIDVKFDAPELTTYTTYDMQTLQVIKNQELPRLLTGVNGLLLRRDVDWKQLTAEERSRCASRLGASLCGA